jgi:pimeloyl-ACP methyl ester carboxylesterase
MATIAHRVVETNGVRMRIAEAGSGPLVILCHGFPESWYSWRHQLEALSEAGFHAVAPDMRGYGGTDQPKEIEKYTLLHLVGDVVGLVAALNSKGAFIAGHDWGAPVAWHAALLRPDLFRAVVGLSVPFRPRGSVLPTSVMPETNDAVFYQLYFQKPGVADAALAINTRQTIRSALYGLSGNAPRDALSSFVMIPRHGEDFFARPDVNPATLPSWLTEKDVDRYTEEFERSGFTGGLNWYRNIDRNWELTASFQGSKVTVPALYIAGDRDLVVGFPGANKAISRLPEVAPFLANTIMLPGCGHWTQQERPAEVNQAMLHFLARQDAKSIL